MKKWIIRFRRPLIWATTNPTGKAHLVWKAPSPAGQMGKVRYWNGGSWTIDYSKAKAYKNYDTAESKAFKLVLDDHSLIGELEITEFVPVSKPKR